jgi:hypothetical protein
MKSYVRFAALIASVCLSSAAYASSINGTVNPVSDDPPLVVGSGWNTFTWFSLNATNQEGAWTFTSAVPISLKITDAYVLGDRFRIFDFGAQIGTTSVPAASGPSTDDFATAFAGGVYSSGTFFLAPGSHSITINTISGLDSGAGGIRADVSTAPAPPPASRPPASA